MKLLRSLAFKLILCATVVAALPLVAQQFKPVQFKEYKLDNGLHVILHSDHTIPIVSTVLYYRTGSRNEDPARTGFAHFFEHLMFEGTDSIKRGEVGQLIQAVGGEVNAFTSFDRTVYHFTVPSNALQLALWIDAQRMRDLKIDTIGVETQRGVVKEERKMRYDNSPYGTWTEKMFKTIFKGTVYGWTPIGSSQHIDVAAIKEFRDFYDKYYIPNNAVLCVSGDFDEAEVRQYVDAYFGGQKRGAEITRDSIKLVPIEGEIRETINDQKAQLPGVFIGYRGAAEGEADGYALEMLTDILASGESSRMYRKLVNETQVAVEASVFPQSLQLGGIVTLIGIAAPGVDVSKVEQAMYAEIDTVIKNGVTEAEFIKAKNIAEAKFVNAKKGMLEIALSLTTAQAMFGNTNFVNTEIERYSRVRREDLQRVAKKYLETKNRVVLTFMPQAEKKKK